MENIAEFINEDDPTDKKNIAKGKPLSIVRLWIERILLGLIFVLLGGVVMVVSKPWGAQIVRDPVDNYLWRIGSTLFLLALSAIAHRFVSLRKYQQIFFALFVLSLALLLCWVFGNYLFDSLKTSDSVPAGWALPKLNDFVVIASVVIVFTLLSKGSLGSIYIQKGRLKLGLIIGVVTFIIGAAGAIPMAELLFKAEGISLARVLPWTPWVLLTVLANGALEEVLYRGLFLRKLEPFFGKFISNFLIALVFTLLHQGSSYTSEQYIFLVVTFPLALAWGYVMQKTDSIWGSILFHAGMDIPIFLGIFSNLP